MVSFFFQFRGVIEVKTTLPKAVVSFFKKYILRQGIQRRRFKPSKKYASI